MCPISPFRDVFAFFIPRGLAHLTSLPQEKNQNKTIHLNKGSCFLTTPFTCFQEQVTHVF
jgi:hypothetical protein